MKKRVVISLLVVVLALTGSGVFVLWKTQVGRSWRAERYARKAEALVKGNAKEAARLACLQAIQLDANNLRATHVFLTVVPPSDFDQLTFLRSRIADIDPDDFTNLEQLAILALATGRHALAGTAIASLSRAKAKTETISELRVRFALATGQPGGAETEAKRLLGIDPANAVGRLVLALSDVQNARKERFAEAATVLRELSVNKAVQLEALRGLREIATQREDTSEALRYAEQIVRGPGCGFVDHLSHADLLFRTSPERLEELLAALTLQAKDNRESLEWIAAWLQKCGHAERALLWVENTPSLGNDSLNGGMLRSKILIDLRAWAPLVTFLSGKDWTEMDFLRKAFLARGYIEQREELRGSSQWREAIVLALKHPQSSRYLLELTRSWPNWNSKTEDLLWEISRQQPRNADWALAQLYRTYEESRSAKSLLRVSRALADLEPANQRAQNNVAFFTLLSGSGNVQQVEGPLTVLYQAQPADPVIASTYALLQLRLQQPESAVATLEKLPVEALRRDDIAVYYAAALQGAGRVAEANKIAAKIKKEQLFPEEVELLQTSLAADSER